jgi:hypothetical protein
MTVVAIHQPTFLPWLGWFDKLSRAETLVLLDAVQFPKKGGTWMNRVRMLVNGTPTWVTMPVDRKYHGLLLVREARIDDQKPWRDRILKTVGASYGRSPYFDEVYPQVEELIRLPTDRVAELNEASVRGIATGVGLDTGKLVRQSDLGVEGGGTDLLVALCKALDASSYMTGDGAGEYLEPEKFEAAGIELVEQRFDPPHYPQLADEYVPGLSVVDALMNCGWQGTAALLRS